MVGVTDGVGGGAPGGGGGVELNDEREDKDTLDKILDGEEIKVSAGNSIPESKVLSKDPQALVKQSDTVTGGDTIECVADVSP